MAGGELRRSYTQMDFSINRVNVRPHLPQALFQQPPLQVRDPRRRYSAMPSNGKKHPTLDIYRPPSEYLPLPQSSQSSHHQHHASRQPQSVRLDGRNSMATAQSLNVHAPEFQMNKIHPSKSTSSVMMNGYGMTAHQGFHGKGQIVHTSKVTMPSPMMHPLQASKSSGNVLHTVLPNMILQQQMQPQQPRSVHFKDQVPMMSNSKPSGSTLKRSKSLSSASDATLQSPLVPNHNNDLGSFSAEIQKDMQQAIKDPNEMSARSLMTLAKTIVERACSDRRYAEAAAKVCISVIENEKKETFLESLLNTCQLSYQERDKVLRAAGTADNRYRPYMNFLNEMYVQLKRSQLQLKTQYDGVPPQILLLTLLSKCFVDCLQAKTLCKIEIETIFFILTSIGKDLEQELPKAMEKIFFNIRDVFVAATSPAAIKRTLLQLIELRASKWQMPASAVMYYYPPR